MTHGVAWPSWRRPHHLRPGTVMIAWRGCWIFIVVEGVPNQQVAAKAWAVRWLRSKSNEVLAGLSSWTRHARSVHGQPRRECLVISSNTWVTRDPFTRSMWHLSPDVQRPVSRTLEDATLAVDDDLPIIYRTHPGCRKPRAESGGSKERFC